MKYSQEQVYLNCEADQFFDRTLTGFGGEFPKGLRESKKTILKQLRSVIDISSIRVLEIGPFIGDLLSILQKEYCCSVTGVEPSTKAVNYCRNHFGIELENAVFSQSKLLSELKPSFDLVIVDDVLSWMSRGEILSVAAAIDRLLEIDGVIYIRDYCPWQAFAYENHHVKNQGVFSFKQSGGHKQFFLQTGMYLEAFSLTRLTEEYQKIKTSAPDSMLWNDAILKKLEQPLHPVRSY